jgi:hypothetical protein
MAGALSIVIIGLSSTRSGERRWHTTLPLCAGAIGLSVVASAQTAGVCVAAAALASMAVACQPPLFAMVSDASSSTSRATAIALVNSVAMSGSFFGPAIVGSARTLTGSFTGAYLLLAAGMALAGLVNLAIVERSARVVPRVKLA